MFTRRVVLWSQTHRVAASLVVVLAVLVMCVSVSVLRAPVAFADSCGVQPDWYTTQYVTWLACEVSSGGATNSITEVVSPVFNQIDADIVSGLAPLSTLPADIATALGPALSPLGQLSGMASSLASLASSVTSGFVSALAALVIPSNADMQPWTDAIGTLKAEQPYTFVFSMATAITSMQSALSASANTGLSAAHQTVTVSTPSGTVTISDYGVLTTGVDMLNAQFASWGVTQSLMYAIGDCCWALMALISIAGDLGSRLGDLNATARSGWDAFGTPAMQRQLQASRRVVQQARSEWSWNERVRGWYERQAQVSERAKRAAARVAKKD